MPSRRSASYLVISAQYNENKFIYFVRLKRISRGSPSKALIFAACYIDVGPVSRGGRVERAKGEKSAAADPRREPDRIGLAVSARCAYSALTTPSSSEVFDIDLLEPRL